MQRTRRARGGFTIFELMLAIGVIAVALMAVLSMTIHSNTVRENLRENEIAKEAAFRKVDEIRALPWGRVSPLTLPSVCGIYVVAAAPPQLVPGLRYDLPVSVDPWNTAVNNLNKEGKLTVILRGISHGGASQTPPYSDPVKLIDIEVLVQWTGVNGPSHYSTRAMLTKGN